MIALLVCHAMQDSILAPLPSCSFLCYPVKVSILACCAMCALLYAFPSCSFLCYAGFRVSLLCYVCLAQLCLAMLCRFPYLPAVLCVPCPALGSSTVCSVWLAQLCHAMPCRFPYLPAVPCVACPALAQHCVPCPALAQQAAAELVLRPALGS